MVTVIVATIGVALAATSAYAFSRWKFRGRGAGLVFLLTTQMIPGRHAADSDLPAAGAHCR